MAVKALHSGGNEPLRSFASRYLCCANMKHSIGQHRKRKDGIYGIAISEQQQHIWQLRDLTAQQKVQVLASRKICKHPNYYFERAFMPPGFRAVRWTVASFSYTSRLSMCMQTSEVTLLQQVTIQLTGGSRQTVRSTPVAVCH